MRVGLPVRFTCLLVLACLPLAAQTGNGVVQGTILDATKATVPGARVTLENTATGVVRTSSSSSVGVYYFGSVPIGPYSLNVEAAGFKKWSGTLNVQAGDVIVI